MAKKEAVNTDSVTMLITNSKGEEVTIRHGYTNFDRKLVIFYIEQRNAQFLFLQVSEKTGNVYPIRRKPLDETKPCDLSISKSLYSKDGWGMAAWAKHILLTGKVDLPPKVVTSTAVITTES